MITYDCNEDKRIVKVITDKEELYSYDDLYEISDLLDEQQEEIERLNGLLLNALSYVPTETKIELLGTLKRDR